MKPLMFSSFYMEPGKSSDTSDYKGEKHRLTWRFSPSEVPVGTTSEVGTFCQHTRHTAQKAHILPPASPAKRSLDLKHSQKFVACLGQLIIKSNSKRASEAAQTGSDEVPTKFRRSSDEVPTGTSDSISATVYAFAARSALPVDQREGHSCGARQKSVQPEHWQPAGWLALVHCSHRQPTGCPSAATAPPVRRTGGVSRHSEARASTCGGASSTVHPARRNEGAPRFSHPVRDCGPVGQIRPWAIAWLPWGSRHRASQPSTRSPPSAARSPPVARRRAHGPDRPVLHP